MRIHELLIDPHERVLVLGASGWLGSTFRNLLNRNLQTLLVAATSRGPFVSWNWCQVTEFQPTVVANFAFLTKRKAASVEPSEFLRLNELLTQQFVEASSLPSVKTAVTVSSGAAIHDPESLYGQLKQREELEAHSLRALGKRIGILRAFSLSGEFISHPKAYAFSDFVMQAKAGRIRVSGDRPTYRRYVSTSDALRVLWATAARGEEVIVETGGELVEMRELALKVSAVVNPDASVQWSEWTTDEPDRYHSDNRSWTRAAMLAAVEPLGLTAQIERVAQYL